MSLRVSCSAVSCGSPPALKHKMEVKEGNWRAEGKLKMFKESSNLLESGSTLQVPNVQELAAAISSGKDSGNEIEIPERYVREEVEMDCGAFSADDGGNDELPVIDLMKLLHDSEHPDEEELSRLGFACREWGFFQLINHGIPENLIEKTKDDIIEFFKLPLKEREKIKQLPGKIEGYGQVFVHSQEQKLDWADVIALNISPFHERDMRFWPTNPTTFRETFDRYTFEVNKVVGYLCRLMAMNLGINPDILHKLFSGQLQTLRINYYPPCKLANKVMGLTSHSDGGGISMLIQTNDVQGLQIKKNGYWYTIKPKPGAFIVNIGDMMEIITNGKYKSIEHRAVINKDMERISIAMFFGLNMDSMLYPLPELVNGDGGALYMTKSVKNFAKEYFSEKLNGKRALESMKLKK